MNKIKTNFINQMKTKTAIAILLLLMLSMSSIVTLLPTTAQTTGHTKTVYPFCGVIPNPVGVDQTLILHIGITDQLTGHMATV